jgi:hypothetical protein
MTEEHTQGLTRREVLKKGAVLGGTVLWVAPMVQAIGMSPALAQTPSETSCCLKIQTPITISTTSYPLGTTVKFPFILENCSTHKSDFDIDTYTERLLVEGGNPVEASAVLVHSSSGSDLDPTDTVQINVSDASWEGATANTYVYRVRATYHCPTAGDTAVPHNVPSGWVYTNEITVTAP